MGDDGGSVGPVDLWPWFDVAFEVVGVQLDQAGEEEVALHVLSRPGGAF